MRRSERLFLIVSPLPLSAWLAASAYLDGLDGWGKWATGPALLGPVLLASSILGLVGLFFSVRARSDRSALLRLGTATLLAGSVALATGFRAIHTAATTDHSRFDPQPYLDAAQKAEQSSRRLRESVQLGEISHQLSCRATNAHIPPEYAPAYERVHLTIPLQISEPGQYRIRLSYSSDLNRKRRNLGAEQVLHLGTGPHEVRFEYAFGNSWGYFVAAPASTLEIRVDRHASLRDIHGDAAALLDENINQKTFRNVTFETRRLEDLANVYTDTVASLVCPQQPPGPPPPEDGLR